MGHPVYFFWISMTRGFFGSLIGVILLSRKVLVHLSSNFDIWRKKLVLRRKWHHPKSSTCRISVMRCVLHIWQQITCLTKITFLIKNYFFDNKLLFWQKITFLTKNNFFVTQIIVLSSKPFSERIFCCSLSFFDYNTFPLKKQSFAKIKLSVTYKGEYL
jgi:hypothetical protein